jgi:ATP-dependent DNA helicase RecQ
MNISLNERLAQQFGFPAFREGQQAVVENLLAGRSSLAIFPTGSGKSLCYQFSALQLPHLTLVVSPLLALMKDQLAFLTSKGIGAASIDSTLTHEEHQRVMAGVRSGEIKILMVSVERFKNERFRRFIQSVPLSMLVVDEAHCISEWGHNFRPDYLKLPLYRQQLNIPLVLLLTATATRKVKLDMARRFDIAEDAIIQTGFYRPNLDLNVVAVSDAEKNAALAGEIARHEGAGIVYVTLQKSAETVASYLQRQGIAAAAYHAGLGSEKRSAIQEQFMANELRVVVATIAFGMGVDKSNIRFVIHYDLPKSIENYSQEIGRAGRDGQLSHCVTLANLDGMTTVENFVYGDTPERDAIAAVMGTLVSEIAHGCWETQISALSYACNIRQLPLKTLLVQLEMAGVIEPQYSYFAEYKYKLLQGSADDLLARFSGERRRFLEALLAHTQFKKVWGELDLGVLAAGYGCERARVVAALDYLHEQQLIELETKGMTEVYRVNESQLQTDALVDTLHRYFADKEQKEIARIQQLVRFFELDSCLSFNLARYFDDAKAPRQCGHCSVCRGGAAHLSRSAQVLDVPSLAVIAQDLAALGARLHQQGKPLSEATASRFLAGISVPLLARCRAGQLDGFGRLSALSLEQILPMVRSAVES